MFLSEDRVMSVRARGARRLSLALGGLLAVAPSLGAQALVRDVNTTPPSTPLHADAVDFVDVGGIWYFGARDAGLGRELVRTDGTPAGTWVVKDIHPGAGDGNPRDLTVVDGVIYFAATSPDSGRELWRSDGTEAGTQLVIDLKTTGTGWSEPGDLAAGDGLLFFSALPGSSSVRRGYATDGTEAGTVLLPTVSDPTGWTPFQGEMYFAADASGFQRELWKTDGTALGTVFVADANEDFGGSEPEQLTVVGSQLFFTARDSSAIGLYVTDGTQAGTQQVADLSTWVFGSQPADLEAYGGELFFTASGGSGGTNRELWKTDGTEVGTQVVIEFVAGEAAGGDPQDLAVANGLLFFSADDGVTGRELYASDGTAAGTTRIDIIGGGGSPDVDEITAMDGRVVFEARTGPLGFEPWTSDGTPGGTLVLADVNPAGLSSSPEGFGVSSDGSAVMFSARGDPAGREPWLSDGTPGGTALVDDVAVQLDTLASHPIPQLVWNGLLFFTADDGVVGREPWVTDGTHAGTQLLADLQGGLASSNAREFVVFDDAVFFVATPAGTQTYLYRTDGTPGGTVQVTQQSTLFIENVTVTGDNLFFMGWSAFQGKEPWVSDGTAAGTTRIADLWPGSLGSDPVQFASFGDTGLVFITADMLLPEGDEPWISDGTLEGTVQLIDIVPGNFGNSSPIYATTFGDRVVFSAHQQAIGREVWITDGTAEGMTPLADSWPGPDGGDPRDFMAVGDRMYFTVESGAEGRELWATDGSIAGTQLLVDADPGTDDGNPGLMTPFGDRLLFVARTGSSTSSLFVTDGTPGGTIELLGLQSGFSFSFQLEATPLRGYLTRLDVGGNEQLWTTDGTVAGTELLVDIDPANLVNDTQFLSAAASSEHVVFRGNDVVTGAEAWASDGTVGGTFPLGDLRAGPADSDPELFVRLGDQVLFVASDGVVGRELYSVPLEQVGAWVAETYGKGCVGTTGDVARMDVSGSAAGGEVLDIGLTGALPSSWAALYYSPGQGVVPFGDCTFLLGPGFAQLALVPTDTLGEASFALPVPSKASLVGLPFFFQYAVVDVGGPVIGLATLSDALEVVIGP